MPTARLPTLAIALSALLWGLWWIPLRWLEAMGFGALPLNALLYGIGGALLIPLVLHRGGLRPRPPAVLASGIALGFALIAWNLALLHGEVVRATLLFYLSVVWASLMEWLVLRHRVRVSRVIAVLLGLAGAWVLLGADGGMPVPRSIGDWFGFVSGLLFAIAVTIASVTKTLDSMEQTCVAFVTAALIGLAATLAQSGGVFPIQAGAAAYLMAGAVSIAWLLPICLLLFWGARYLPPGRVSLILLLEIIAAAISAALLAGEPFGMKEAAGCLLIAVSGVVDGWFSDRPEPAPIG
jgi:drug/metabolite transporter (DMT)-like permease